MRRRRRAGAARQQRSSTTGEIGLPAARQGVSRRRRARHADRRTTRRSSTTRRAAAEREAAAAFGDGTVFVERYVERGRHVEIQVLADAPRQRRLAARTGVLDPAAPPEDHRGGALPRRRRRPARGGWPRPPIAAAKAVGYVGAGTVEFLLEPDGRFWFLEMNTRLQVEHPVTELVTGLDLVELQLAVADGRAAARTARSTAPLHGHAIEARPDRRGPGRRLPTVDGHVHDVRRSTTACASTAASRPARRAAVLRLDGRQGHRPRRRPATRAIRRWRRLCGAPGCTGRRPTATSSCAVSAIRRSVAGDLHTGFLDDAPVHEPITGRLGASPPRPSRSPTRPHADASAGVWRGIPSGWRNNPAVDQAVALLNGEHERRSSRTGSDAAGSSRSTASGSMLVILDARADRRRARGRRRAPTPRGRRGTARCATSTPMTATSRSPCCPAIPSPTTPRRAGSLVAPMPGAVVRVLVASATTCTPASRSSSWRR